MKNKIKWESPVLQYFIGLIVNVFVVLILIINPVTNKNLQIPVNQCKNNLWKGSDVLTYYYPAINYLEWGTIGYINSPSLERTIGYPLYLAILIKIFGKHWIYYAFFLQAVLYAFIYPTITKIIRILLPGNKKIIIWTFVFLLLTGTYFTTTTIFLSDTLFTLILTTGIYFGIISVLNKNWFYLLLHLLLIGIAAQIKPILFLFAIPDIFILVSVAKKYNIQKDLKVKKEIIISAMILLLLGNLPTLRNYIHYGIVTPSTIMENNLLYNHATKILLDKKNVSEIKNIYTDTNYLSPGSKINKAISIYETYPLITAKFFFKNFFVMMTNEYYSHFGGFWGYAWRNKFSEVHKNLKSSYVIFF